MSAMRLHCETRCSKGNAANVSVAAAQGCAARDSRIEHARVRFGGSGFGLAPNSWSLNKSGTDLFGDVIDDAWSRAATRPMQRAGRCVGPFAHAQAMRIAACAISTATQAKPPNQTNDRSQCWSAR